MKIQHSIKFNGSRGIKDTTTGKKKTSQSKPHLTQALFPEVKVRCVTLDANESNTELNATATIPSPLDHFPKYKRNSDPRSKDEGNPSEIFIFVLFLVLLLAQYV